MLTFYDLCDIVVRQSGGSGGKNIERVRCLMGEDVLDFLIALRVAFGKSVEQKFERLNEESKRAAEEIQKACDNINKYGIQASVFLLEAFIRFGDTCREINKTFGGDDENEN